MSAIIEHPSRQLLHIRAALYSEPWAITEPWLEKLCAIAEAHADGKPPEFKAQDSEDEGYDPGFDLINDVAIVPVSGPIFPKANLMTALSGATALSELSETIKSALSIRPSAVILNMDTPGGSVSGLADFCSWLHGVCQASPFPIVSLTNPLSASAGFMISSQCDMAYSTEGGATGSIGVISRMNNYDRAEKNSGNDPITLTTHELKGIGYGPVTPNQQTEMKRGMMAHMAKFQEAVVRGRPNIDIEKVSTGQTWMGKSANSDPSALDMGLIDGVSTLDALISQYGNPSK